MAPDVALLAVTRVVVVLVGGEGDAHERRTLGEPVLEHLETLGLVTEDLLRATDHPFLDAVGVRRARRQLTVGSGAPVHRHGVVGDAAVAEGGRGGRRGIRRPGGRRRPGRSGRRGPGRSRGAPGAGGRRIGSLGPEGSDRDS
jgi:hypothetical protein